MVRRLAGRPAVRVQDESGEKSWSDPLFRSTGASTFASLEDMG